MTMWQREGMSTVSLKSPRNYHITQLKRVANGEHVLKELHRGNIYYFTLTTCPGIKSTLYKSHRVRALQDIRKRGITNLSPQCKLNPVAHDLQIWTLAIFIKQCLNYK